MRHLLRLAAGRHSDGRPLGRVRPATARLLERIFGVSIGELLSPPAAQHAAGGRSGLSAPQVLRVAISVVIKGAEVLMVRPRGELGDGVAWQFPAGIVKPGERSEAVAVRETLAETGIHCVVVRGLGGRQHPTTNVLCDYLLCEYVAGQVSNLDSEENIGVAWVARERLAGVVPLRRVYPPVLAVLGAANA